MLFCSGSDVFATSLCLNRSADVGMSKSKPADTFALRSLGKTRAQAREPDGGVSHQQLLNPGVEARAVINEQLRAAEQEIAQIVGRKAEVNRWVNRTLLIVTFSVRFCGHHTTTNCRQIDNLFW